MCSPRVQRWAVLLRAYEYKIVYKPGKEHSNEDALSRLPLPQTEEEEKTDQVLMIEVMDRWYYVKYIYLAILNWRYSSRLGQKLIQECQDGGFRRRF